MEFEEWEKYEYRRYAIKGPSHFQLLLMINDIKGMLHSFFTGKADYHEKGKPWLDGTFCDPALIEEERERQRHDRQLDQHLAWAAMARRE